MTRLDWRGPVFLVSAVTGEGCRELVLAVMNRLEQYQAQAATEHD
jgi:GTP-binding protein